MNKIIKQHLVYILYNCINGIFELLPKILQLFIFKSKMYWLKQRNKMEQRES